MKHELISREMLLAELLSLPYGYAESFGGKYAIEAIKSAPAAKPNDVVLCEECRFFIEYSKAYKREGVEADGDCYIRVIHTDNDEQFCAVGKSDFCSIAERRNEGVRLDKP